MHDFSGWQSLDSYTDVELDTNRDVIAIETTRHDLDKAVDAAEQFMGRPFVAITMFREIGAGKWRAEVET